MDKVFAGVTGYSAVKRRNFLLGLGTLPIALGVPGFAVAQTGDTAQSGFLNYTQKELDDAYDQRVWASNVKEMVEKYASDSARVREAHAYKTLSYGEGPDETMDVFTTSQPNAPIHLHIHGGAWRALTKDDAAFLAPPILDAGAVYIALNFSVIPAVRLPGMIDQARRAVAWIHEHAAEFGGDPDRIHVSGHSSGAHMAGVLMTTDWEAHGLPIDVIKSGLLVSGIYDLEPVMMSARSTYVELSDAEIDALSPIRHLDRLVQPVLAVYGMNESPEFQRQSQAFIAAAAEVGKAAGLQPLADVNHFEAPYLLDKTDSLAARLSLSLMS